MFVSVQIVKCKSDVVYATIIIPIVAQIIYKH